MQTLAFIFGAVVVFGLGALVVGAILKVSLWAWDKFKASSDWLLRLFFGLVSFFGFGFLVLLILTILQGLFFGTE